MIFRRLEDRPLLTRESLPGDLSAVFNPGAARFRGRVHFLLRAQTRGRESLLWPAWSEDGLRLEVAPDPVELDLGSLPQRPFHVYDPRLTVIEDGLRALVAMDFDAGCRLGLLESADGRRWSFAGMASREDERNGVLFPEKVGGRYLRLDRPNAPPDGGVMAGTGDRIRLSASGDLLNWEPLADLARGRPRFWDEIIGPGSPPVKTREGWLFAYHGVATHLKTAWIYQAGLMLLDLEDPSRLIGRSRENVLEPRESWELAGQVPGVVFPSALVVRDLDDRGFAPNDAEALLYYGAADTCVGVAAGEVGRLLGACDEVNP